MKKQWVSLVLAALILTFFLLCLNRLESRRRELGLQQLEDALRRGAVACYAAEGQYPPDVAYLRRHYGVLCNEEEYIIHYQFLASNLMPEITVLERK